MNKRSLGFCAVLVFFWVPVATLAQTPSPSGADAGAYLADSAITAKIKAKLLAEDEAGSLVTVVVNTDSAGGVILRGTTKTRADADKATRIARATAGVTSVTNRIEVPSEIARGAK